MVHGKRTSDPPRALWALPASSKKSENKYSKLLFWKRPGKAEQEQPASQRNPAIKASNFPERRPQHNPEWRRDPNKFLKPYCQPVVIKAIQSLSKQTSCNIHFINALRVESSLAPILAVLGLPPTTADRYVPLLRFFFRTREVIRISADEAEIDRRILRLRLRPQDSYTWWDMLREDLNEVCERAVKDYFEREEHMWIVPRLIHRGRRVNCSDQYRHREVKDWRFNDGKWWLEAAFPKIHAIKARKTEKPEE